jgi:hypothetical protein
MQRVPNFDLVGHDGDMVCEECGEETEFLITEMPDKHRCPACFSDFRPEFSEAVADFASLLKILIEMKSRHMTLDEMHELYGNKEDEENTEG